MGESRCKLRICMLTYSFYESDNRVRRYAESLARRGDHVDVISLRREGQLSFSELNGVHVHRVQQRVRNEHRNWNYLYRIIKFFFRSSVQLTRNHLIRPYDLIHAHSIPDFEVFAAVIPKLSGTPVILDIHDIVPELYCNKFNVKKDSIIYKALVLVEKASIGFADHAIVSNDLWRNRLVSRSVSSNKCSSILNYPDEQVFSRKDRKTTREKTVLLYPGTLNHHQGLDIAVMAFAKIRDAAPRSEFHIYGDGPAKKDLSDLVRRYGLQGRVLLKDPVSLDEIVGVMAQADIGVIPKKNDDFGGEAFSTKSLEFMILGIPIIVARTRIDRFYFNDSIVKFFEPENVDDLAVAMIALMREQMGRLSQNKIAGMSKNTSIWIWWMDWWVGD
jgi:glycosyltransferase involved in cell wall biosynthesis